MTRAKVVRETKVLVTLVLLLAAGSAAFAQPGRPDFLKPQDNNFAILAHAGSGF